MNQKPGMLYRVPFYPFLLGLYPVLYLWLANVNRVPAFVVPRSLIASMAIAVVVFLLALLAVRRWLKAAAVSGLFLALFFFYGHLFALIDSASIAGFVFGRHRYFLPLWLLIFVVGSFFILRSRSNFRSATWALNLVLLFLVTITLAQIGYQSWRNPLVARKPAHKAASAAVSPVAAQSGPDVYYILLDAFSREDLMKKTYFLDNSALAAQLQQLGFVVPDCTQSNYNNTIFSMSATLNMDYLKDLGYDQGKLPSLNAEPLLSPLVINSAVRKQFESLGYKMVVFKPLYTFIDIKDADIYYDYEATTNPMDKLETLNFENLFLKTTVLRTLVELEENSPEKFDRVPPALLQVINPSDSKFSSRNFKQYQQNVFALDTLEKIPAIPGKKFVYAHLFDTHVPFTFTQDGGFRGDFRDSNEAYRDQVIYTSKRIVEVVKTILQKSAVPPIIILQGDHSWTYTLSDLPKILNAYYLPNGGGKKVYPQITPVNTFRLIFDTYFNGKYPLLPDVSYVLSGEVPGGQMTVPDSCVHSK